MTKILSVSLFLALSLTSLGAQAGPLTPGLSYLPFYVCNDGGYTFFETYEHGTSVTPAQGVLAIQGAGAPVNLVALNSIAGTAHAGVTLSTVEFGTFTLSPEGEGHVTHQVCKQSGNTVVCGNETIELRCDPVHPTPSGVSSGNGFPINGFQK